jgi:hypothetical protein
MRRVNPVNSEACEKGEEKGRGGPWYEVWGV